MRKSHAPCQCCGQHGDPGLTAALSVEEGSTPEPERVRMETAVLDVPRYCAACIADLLINLLIFFLSDLISFHQTFTYMADLSTVKMTTKYYCHQ